MHLLIKLVSLHAISPKVTKTEDVVTRFVGMGMVSIDCKAPGMHSIEALQQAVYERAASKQRSPYN
jgi:hypothetical protein